MTTHSTRRLILAVVMACAACLSAIAQSEKVSVRMTPQPNQSVRLRMVQEMDMQISPDAGAGPAAVAVPAMQMTMKSVVSLRQETGAANQDGTIDAQMVYDEVQIEIAMNGQPMPGADATAAGLVGKKITLTYDKLGNVSKVGIPGDLGGLGPTEAAIRALLESAFNSLPGTPIGVGETTTAPLDMTLPLPLPGAGGGPMKLDGQVQLRLVSIDKDASGRTAKFEHVTNGKMVQDLLLPAQAGPIKIGFDFTVSGRGTSLKDLDTGVLRSSASDTTFNGKMSLSGDAAGGPQMPAMNLQGTLKVTVTSGN
jgi:hypothetical protein